MSPEDRLVHYRCAAIVSNAERPLCHVEDSAHAMLAAERPIALATVEPDSIKVECFHGPAGTTTIVAAAKDISARGWVYFVARDIGWSYYIEGDEDDENEEDDAEKAILALSEALRARIAKLTGLP